MASLVASIVVLVLVPIRIVGYAVNNVNVNVESTSAGRGDKICRVSLLLANGSQSAQRSKTMIAKKKENITMPYLYHLVHSCKSRTIPVTRPKARR